ncbi:hypothetical protein [Methylocystis hirsuta]|uniref:Uncharacterized protein n=1 Tax=Methylocystis hirsuta TaxID=369798 RepID=A0A3M9XIN6_9HYPH|nr:hypothetical protein [Methylocystis hirsuta]RNJ47937.1 hypothetical protein D1O30_21060 [Methylocystis hirsuta]
MPQSPNRTEKTQATATHDDMMDVLGNMDEAKALAILALRPTITDIERASMWLSGDTDVFGPGQPLAGVPDQIVTILTADEEENSLRAR